MLFGNVFIQMGSENNYAKDLDFLPKPTLEFPPCEKFLSNELGGFEPKIKNGSGTRPKGQCPSVQGHRYMVGLTVLEPGYLF